MVVTVNIFSGTQFDPFRSSRDLSDIFYPKSVFDMSRLKKKNGTIPIILKGGANLDESHRVVQKMDIRQNGKHLHSNVH